MRHLAGCLLVCASAGAFASIEYRHGVAFISALKYPPGFTHFDYVNPDAPKGGRVRVPRTGTWDSFNSFIHKGRAAAGLSFTNIDQPLLLYDRLLEPAADEATSQYARLADGVAVAPDYSSVTFRLRAGAFWHDGEPVTVDDLVYTLDVLKRHGSPVVKTLLKDVAGAERISADEVRYHAVEGAPENPNLPLLIGGLPVLPKHYWTARDPSSTTIEPPLGSGPYRIESFVVGRHVTYERVRDWWGRDLPVNRGRYNFDEVKFDYFRDDHVMREAHKSNLLDIRPETVAKSWAVDYDIPQVHAGLLKKELLKLSRPAGLWWPVFWNLRHERFQDMRVREALWALYDYVWINRVLLHGYYDRGLSIFQGSQMAQSGLPSADELELLEPWREHLPPRVFTEVYEPPDGDGQGHNRDNLERALALFEAAGWIVRDGRLVHEATHERFKIEFVVVAQTLVRALLPYMETLERVGIECTARAPEVSNWLYRMRRRDFDGGMVAYIPSSIPGLELRSRFGSDNADIEYSLNWSGVKDPAVDYLIDRVIGARTERDFFAATRAFDRVMLWNFYLIPGMALPGYRLVYWDRFGQPATASLDRSTYLDTWWWDADKDAYLAEELPRVLAGGEGR